MTAFKLEFSYQGELPYHIINFQLVFILFVLVIHTKNHSIICIYIRIYLLAQDDVNLIAI